MQLVVDASVAIAASHSPIGFARFKLHDLVAPQLLVVEPSSVLHEMAWREEITPDRAQTMRDRILGAPINIRSPAKLVKSAWELADEMGWPRPTTPSTSHSPACSIASWSRSTNA